MMKSILISFVLNILLNYAAFSHAAGCAEIDFNKIDVVFALDGSLSIGESNFKSSTSFLIDVVGQLQIGRNKASVGILQYPLDSQGDSTKEEVVLGTSNAKQELQNMIGRINFQNGRYTNTHQAIKDGVKMLTSKGRNGIPKVLVVITDGKSMTPLSTQLEAQKAQQQNIAVISVGVGNEVVEDELIAIAGDRLRVFYVSDFDVLVKFVTTLSDNIRRWPNKACFDQEEGKVRVQVKKNLPTLTDLPIGKRVEIECTVGPFNKQITWTWLKDGEILSRANADAVETTSGLRVRLALVMTESSSGQYVVRVTYPNGLTKTCPAFLVNVNKKLPSVSEEKPGSVDNCKNGIFNKVFYESDVPKYCVINEDGPNDGLCMDMNNLYYKLKPFVTRQVREQKNKDWTYEYKRYNLQVLGNIYHKQELNDDHPNVQTNGFQKLFVDGLNYLQEIHPEINAITIDGHKFGATKFCEMALTQFAMPNNVLLGLVQPKKCPKPSSPVCFKSPENRFQINFPTNLNLVYYKDPATPTSCYIPRDHSVYKKSTGEQCVFVDDAINKLNQIDGTQHNDKVPHGRNLLPGFLRIYHEPYSTTRVEPEPYRWSTYRNNKKPSKHVTDILKDIDDAFGYEQDHKITVTTKNKYDKNVPKTIQMSYQAFCAAVVEMIPMKLDDLRSITKIRDIDTGLMGDNRFFGFLNARISNAHAYPINLLNVLKPDTNYPAD